LELAQYAHKPHTLPPCPIQDNRYWTMWKLPMFGCSDPSQVLREVAACTKAFPDARVRLVSFDPIRLLHPAKPAKPANPSQPSPAQLSPASSAPAQWQVARPQRICHLQRLQRLPRVVPEPDRGALLAQGAALLQHDGTDAHLRAAVAVSSAEHAADQLKRASPPASPEARTLCSATASDRPAMPAPTMATGTDSSVARPAQEVAMAP
jgi:hypothetical protein